MYQWLKKNSAIEIAGHFAGSTAGWQRNSLHLLCEEA